jgi:hypothetical protein
VFVSSLEIAFLGIWEVPWNKITSNITSFIPMILFPRKWVGKKSSHEKWEYNLNNF